MLDNVGEVIKFFAQVIRTGKTIETINDMPEHFRVCPMIKCSDYSVYVFRAYRKSHLSDLKKD
jgi:hypothetical protein